mgnify:CR=1 FL=1
MNDKQLDFFKKEHSYLDIEDKTIDVADIIPDKKIVPKRYFIKPTGGKHPFAAYHERLNTEDFPYIRDTIEYPYVMLQGTDLRNNSLKLKNVSICIHKLVARAFLNPGELDPYDYSITVVDHIDGKPWNYRLNNLRFVTRSENAKGARVRSKEQIFKVGLLKELF